MSHTSLWGIDKDWKGKELTEYDNSWLFSPMADNCLFMKYIKQSERTSEFGFEHKTFLSWVAFDDQNKKYLLLNERINNCDNQIDRVVWELSNLSVFSAKDKAFVAKCVREFAETYSDIKNAEHLYERFQQIAKDIENLPDEYEFFVMHPNSIDDNVERWFYDYKKEEDKKLSDWDKFVCEFTLIENEKVVGFSDNLEMCKVKE